MQIFRWIDIGILTSKVLTKPQLFAFSVAVIAPHWWLARMTDISRDNQGDTVTLAIYGILVGVSVCTTFLGCYFLYATTLRASVKLHDRMTMTIVQSPVLFFDTNPSGRIMNRFSKDIGAMDDMLPFNLVYTVNMCLYALGAFFLPAATNVWLFLASFPVLAIIVYTGRYYLKSSREMKRLEAVRCSPVYSHIAETVLGLEVIRSSGMVPHFLEKFYG